MSLSGFLALAEDFPGQQSPAAAALRVLACHGTNDNIVRAAQI